jgi:transglutaminase-like putative cysteine protease
LLTIRSVGLYRMARIMHDVRFGGTMPSLNIRHVTTYRYRQPVAFGEHRMMLRPRDTHDQRVIEARLRISPQPKTLRFVQDAFGNHVGIAQFSDRAEELCFESTVRLERLPVEAAGFNLDDARWSFPVDYTPDEMPDLAHCIERHHPDPGQEVGRWARQFLPSNGSIGAFEFLTRLSQGINCGFLYRRREAKGIRQPVETLRLGHGSCRDFAMLMIEAARSLGLAARFASGYLAVALDDPEEPMAGSARGSTHAWAQVYLPGAGWLDFDPTSGSAGTIDLVTVAVVRDPRQAIPLHGTFIGYPSDHLGMEVRVQVTSDTPAAPSPNPRRSERSHSLRLKSTAVR